MAIDGKIMNEKVKLFWIEVESKAAILQRAEAEQESLIIATAKHKKTLEKAKVTLKN